MRRFEELPNELIYQVFTYLNYYDVYRTFNILNGRFKQLVSSYSPIQLDLSTDTDFTEFDFDGFIIKIRQNIYSIRCFDEFHIGFFSKLSCGSSFINLQSITLINLSSKSVVSILKDIKLLSHLYSLILHIDDYFTDIKEIYQLIFSFAALKHIEISLSENDKIQPLPKAQRTETNNNIEYLNIDYLLTFDELHSIVSYTPKLRSLVCQGFYESKLFIEKRDLIILSNLQSLTIKQCYIPFDHFEVLCEQISSNLKTLRINTFDDELYIDPDRWEQLINKTLPNLNQFYFSNHQDNIFQFQQSRYHRLLNRFTSLFWTKRKWMFELQINHTDTIFLIQPQRRQWFHYEKKSHKSYTQFRIENSHSFGLTKTMIESVIPTTDMIKFNYLNIDCMHLNMDTFIHLINSLPHLHSLRILSLSKDSKIYSNISLLKYHTSITDFYYEQIQMLEELCFIITLCPKIKHMSFGCEKKDVYSFLQYIFTLNFTLDSIHVYVEPIDNQLIENLTEMTKRTQSLSPYKIERFNNRIQLRSS